ncbi:MAG: elongation factor 1-beta [Candidatus Bathyarchaeota archaeon]|nr:elongation factor 1-beta [Candidatus Bathyarchaeota archaeon]
MGHVVVTYKVFPEDIVKDFAPLKEQIKGVVPDNAEIMGYGEEPIAFGLVALLTQIQFSEDETGIADDVENKLSELPGISQVQTLMVRRTSR